MQMWTSKLAMSEFTSYQYIGDTGNQSNPSQRKYLLQSNGGDLPLWFLFWVFQWKKLKVEPWKSRAEKLISCRKIKVELEN